MGKKSVAVSAAAIAVIAIIVICSVLFLGRFGGIFGQPNNLEPADSPLPSVSAVSGSNGASYEPNTVLVSVGADVSESNLSATLEAIGASGVEATLISASDACGESVLSVSYEGEVSVEAAIQALKSEDGISTAEPNYLREFYGDTSSSSLSEISLSALSTPQWHLDEIHALDAWNIQKSNGSVTVAVIDSGVNVANSDLADNVIVDYAYNAVTKKTGSRAVSDTYNHGTMVASAIAAKCENGIGVDGVSYNAKILPVKVDDSRTGNIADSTVITAIDYVVSLKASAKTPELANIRVINLSLGGAEYNTLLGLAVQRALDAGILVVAAAGNESSSSVSYPAAFDGVLGISALKQLSAGECVFDDSYSNHGTGIDLSAPGTSITLLSTTGGLVSASGTSFSAPIVSGVAALLFASDMSMSVQEVSEYLTSSATDLGEVGWDEYYGYGMVDAQAALLAREKAITIAIPQANENLEYNGSLIEGVSSGFGYTLTGTTSAVEVGSYAAIATLNKKNYVWSDGTTEQKTINWSILPSTQVVVNDPSRSEQWNLDAMDIPKAWNIVKGEGKVTIGVVGEGIDVDNPDLTDNLLLSKGYLGDTQSVGKAYVDDVWGTGSVIASVLSAIADNGVGIAGATYNAKILPLKSSYLSSSSSNEVNVMRCIDYAVNQKLSAPAGSDMANLKVLIVPWYGLTSWMATTGEPALDRANAAGITIVRIQYNSGLVSTPVRSGEIVVSGLKQLDGGGFGVMDSSVYGPYISVCAPAENVPVYNRSAELVYSSNNGAVAAANVAAVAALLYAKYPDFSPELVKEIIQNTAVDLGDEGWDQYYGYGMVNAYNALNYFNDRTMVEIPVAETGLTYNGADQTGVHEGPGYTVTDGKATDAGDYVATASLLSDKYVWSDGTTGDKTIEWSIGKRKTTVPVISAGEYTGSSQSANPGAGGAGEGGFGEGVSASGDLSATEPGEYTITLTLTDPNACWEDGTTDPKVITWRIEKGQNEITDLQLEGWDVFGTPNTPTCAAKFGTPTYSYGASKTGVFSATVPTTEGTWWVKAYVAETSSYTSAEALASFVITNNSIKIPVATTGLVYTGSLKVGVEEGVGYSLSGVASAVHAGTYQAIATLNDAGAIWSDGTTDPKTIEWSVAQAQNSISGLAISGWMYGDAPNAPNCNPVFGEAEYSYSDSESGTYIPGAPSTVGTWWVKAEVLPTNDYAGAVATYSFKISAKKVTSADITLGAQLVYNTEKQSQTIASVLVDGVSVESYTVSNNEQTNAGSYELSISFSGNYTGVVKRTFTIERVSIEEVEVLIPDCLYTGSPVYPSVTITYKGKSLVSGRDYSSQWKNNTEVGYGVFVITGYGNFMGQAERSFNICSNFLAAAARGVSVCRHALTDSDPIHTTIYYSGTLLTEGVDYEILYEDSTAVPTQAGTYTLYARGMGLYNGTIRIGTLKLYTQPEALVSGCAYHVQSYSDKTFVLDVAKVKPERGSNVSVWTNNGGANQLFTFELGKDGYYVIRNVANPELVLDAAGATPKIGANVSTWSTNGGLNQKWIIVPDEKTGTYSIASAYDSRFVLDAAGATPKIGANVSIWTSNGGANQKWRFVSAMDVSEAAITIKGMNRMETGKPLAPEISVSLYGSVLNSGVDYEVLYNGSSALPVSDGSYEVVVRGLGKYEGSVSVGTMNIIALDEDIEIGTRYHIQSYVDKSFVLDVANVKPVRGSNVSVWTNNGGLNQLFTIELGSDGYCVIRNVANPDLVLDAAGATPKIGANVSTWSANGGLNQKWLIVPDEKTGSFVIASAFDRSFVLDAAGASPKIGANVSLWTGNGGSNQKWLFVALEDALIQRH